MNVVVDTTLTEEADDVSLANFSPQWLVAVVKKGCRGFGPNICHSGRDYMSQNASVPEPL